MRNYQVGILTGLLYVLFIIFVGVCDFPTYESHWIHKPVVIFEYLSKEDDEFDVNLFVDELYLGSEKTKAIERLMVETHAKEKQDKSTENESATSDSNGQQTSKYSKEEINLLESVTQLEAGNQGLEGQRRVVDVILNRVESKVFPNNIHDVIFQPGQFSTSKKIGKNANIFICSDVKKAVQMEISGKRIDPESLYFATRPITQKGLYQFGDHYFSR